MDTKWKKSKAILGLLSFVLGISLLLEGALYFGTAFSSSNTRHWMEDSFAQDWRDTGEFRSFVSSRLENLITMGAGGYVYDARYYYDTGRTNYYSINSNRIEALHEAYKEDQNILYRIEKEGKLLYSNWDGLKAVKSTSTVPEGYGFFLMFDGKTVRIWKDDVELDVYGDGYYRFDSGDSSDQWYVPGYKNFTVDEAGAAVKVTMAVIDEPQIFIKGNYGKTGSDQYNRLYYLKDGLDRYHDEVMCRTVRMGVGLGLFLVYVLLRKSKQRADQAVARWTGKIWFEVKIVLLLLLVYFNFPRMTVMYDVWDELVYAYTPSYGTASGPATSASEAIPYGDIVAELEQNGMSDEEIEDYLDSYYSGFDITPVYPIEQATSVGTAVTILSENGGWLLREALIELASHTGHLLTMFWGLYLLLVNDGRYNKRPWKHGVFAMLCAQGLDLPLQRRLSRMNGLAGLALLLSLCELTTCLVLMTVYRVLPAWALWNLFLLPVLAAAGLYAWASWRNRQLWTDFGAVIKQAAAIRAGALESEITLQEDSDLYPLSDDLNHIRQGLHQAVEESTRNERMKVELVTNVSHDLKTPLTSIISYTELLAQEPLEPPASEYVQIMGEKAQRLKSMVQDVFEVSKAASGQLPVKLEQLDYARLLRQTLADMAQAIEESGLTLRASIPETEVPITADSDRLYRVFQNLIGNALKYSLPGSRVYLALIVDRGKAIASVRNTSAAELKPGADYTARFVRGDESRTDGGSGLGLSIADSFTRACGGELTISTEADLFTAVVTFPLEQR